MKNLTRKVSNSNITQNKLNITSKTNKSPCPINKWARRLKPQRPSQVVKSRPRLASRQTNVKVEKKISEVRNGTRFRGPRQLIVCCVMMMDFYFLFTFFLLAHFSFHSSTSHWGFVFESVNIKLTCSLFIF